MIITLKTNGDSAWVARIIGDCPKFGYQRQFMPRLRNAERGAGLASFVIVDDVADSYEVCYGDPDCREFVEIYPPTKDVDGFYFMSELPGQEYVPEQDTYSLSEPLTPPAVNPSRERYHAVLKSRETAYTEDEFGGDNW